jgi:hypothetical protein
MKNPTQNLNATKGGVSGTSVPDTPMGLAGKDSHADAQVKQE